MDGGRFSRFCVSDTGAAALPGHRRSARVLRPHLDVGVRPEANWGFLQDHFGSRMMGRCFCLTSEGHMGVGSGFMDPNDEVVVPLGCSTPVLLRPEGNRGEYRFVGDICVNGYMHGKAMDDLKSDNRRVKRDVIH